MNRKIWIDVKWCQYLVPAVSGLLFYCFLYFHSETTFANLQLPVGQYKNNIWFHSDYLTYYRPAKNFLETGVFGNGTNPDPLRTVGYPAFLALLIKLFKNNWIYYAYFLHCIIIPIIYPLIYSITEKLINRKTARISLIISLFSGLYFGRMIFIGTDLVFMVFFLAAILFLIKYFENQRKATFLILYFITILISSLIRPSLMYYYPAHLMMVFFLDKKYKVFVSKSKLWKFSILTTILVWAIVNISSYRNYMNYGFFKPTIVLNANYINHVSRDILRKEGKNEIFDSLYRQQYRIEDYTDRMKWQNETVIRIIEKYPFSFIKVIISNIKNTLFDNGLINPVGNYFNYNWREEEGLKYSAFMHITFLIYAVGYIILYILAAFGIYRIIRKQDWILLLLIFYLLSIFLLPPFIFGSGGSRLRIPVEWIIVILGCVTIVSILDRIKLYNKRIKPI